MPPPNVVNREPMQQRFPVLFGPNGQPVSVITPEGEYPFPAGDPPAPKLPHGTPARAHVPPPYGNLITQPRRHPRVRLTPFQQLRSLAEFDLMQIAMQDCRGQILGMEWEVAPRKEFEGEESAQAEVDKARAWVEQPDPAARLDLDTWLGRVIDEIYTTDALTLLPRRTLGGQALGLEQIDGATIRPLVDDRGRPPVPPSPAYQQIAHGMAETEFTLDELWYLPRNPRPDVPYGRSNVEQVLWTVNLAIRRYQDDLSYYTTGNIPEALYSTPESWTQRQIDEFQAWFDVMLSGRDDRRSGNLRFVPGGQGAGPHPMKTREWRVEFNEWLARVICWAFQVSPLPLVRMMNRGTAATAEMASIEGGVRPVAAFIAGVMNRFIRYVMGLRRVEFRWGDDEVEDPRLTYERNLAYAHGGAMTFNQLRTAIGLDEYEGEWANRPMLVSAAGQVIFLDEIEEQLAEKQQMSQLLAGSFGNAPAPGSPSAIPADAAGSQGDDPDDGDDGPASKFAPALAAYGREVQQDLAKWRRMALRRASEGKPQRAFRSEAIPPALAKRIADALGVG